jgi:hypothetical protein
LNSPLSFSRWLKISCLNFSLTSLFYSRDWTSVSIAFWAISLSFYRCSIKRAFSSSPRLRA